MPPRAYRTTGVAFTALKTILPFRIRVTGEENLVDNPTIFAVNHFTRFETLLVPYVLYQLTGRQVRTLADHALFFGLLGKHLRACGVMPTNQPSRNDTIIGELMTGHINWVIYPEGGLVKNKKVIDGRQLQIDLPHRSGPPHTGAALLALMAQTYKQRFLRAQDKADDQLLAQLDERFSISRHDGICDEPTVIQPVTITYFPMRAHHPLTHYAARLLRSRVSFRTIEELRVEGSLLLSRTEIGVHFGAPIYVDSVRPARLRSLRLLATRSGDAASDPSLKSRARRLTDRLVREIYDNVEINFDHLYCTVLHAIEADRVPRQSLLAAIYLAGRAITRLPHLRIHPSLSVDLDQLVTGQPHAGLARIESLALREGVIRIEGDDCIILHDELNKPVRFHANRLDRMTRVIANELEPVQDAVRIIRSAARRSAAARPREVAAAVRQDDLDRYTQAYETWHDPELSRPIEVGQPQLLNGRRSGTGVVLVHGYLASPEQMRPLADALHERGFNVYVVRLAGHGTAPDHLTGVSWQNWMASLRRGYAVMSRQCDRVVVGGFSLGGLMALLLAAEDDPSLAGVFCVNTPMRLRDRRAVFATVLVRWNALLRAVRITNRHASTANTRSESPDLNYNTNFLRGVVEMRAAIRSCRRRLARITAPALIVQSTDDPVIDPASADIIVEALASDQKRVLPLTSDRHVVVRDDAPPELVDAVCKFVEQLSDDNAPPRPRRFRWFPRLRRQTSPSHLSR